MNKFKVGDVVWISSIKAYNYYEDYPKEYFGQIGIIYSASVGYQGILHYPYQIEFKKKELNNAKYMRWHDTNLTLLTETAYLNKTTYQELAVDTSNHTDSTIYHISWLEEVLENFKKEGIVHSINGNMTMDEFISKYSKKKG